MLTMWSENYTTHGSTDAAACLLFQLTAVYLTFILPGLHMSGVPLQVPVVPPVLAILPSVLTKLV